MSMPRQSGLHYIGKNAKMGKNVEVGYGAYIQEGAKIGKNVKISPFA
ncbi:MAG: UDP-3-O-(3-hydroxymyristoyl)glucosamine N-acyltransferase, partial [Candidatus Bathyarchaeia archaeon]